jgi:hypothetical protein
MKNQLNIIILSSPIPSNPSTKVIDKTIESLSLLRYPVDSKIILAHDYPAPESKNKDAYFKYYKILEHKYKHQDNIITTIAPKFVHMAGNLRNAFNYVDSQYVLVLSHDFIFVRSVDINLLISDMDQNPKLKHVRFNKRKNTPRGGDCDTRGKSSCEVFNKFSVSANHEYISTSCWSDINHISPVHYYRDIILKECSDGRNLESFFYSKIKNMYEKNNDDLTAQTHEKYGNYLFDELGANPYIYHTDGREAFDGRENHDHDKTY